MKTYVLMLSEYFPASHPCHGNKTHFYDKIQAGKKLHTIRANPELWAKRATEVHEGRAQISVRQWTGKARASKQIELFRLGQKTEFKEILIADIVKDGRFYCTDIISIMELVGEPYRSTSNRKTDFDLLSKNDGLTEDQFWNWFNPENELNFVFCGIMIYFNDILK